MKKKLVVLTLIASVLFTCNAFAVTQYKDYRNNVNYLHIDNSIVCTTQAKAEWAYNFLIEGGDIADDSECWHIRWAGAVRVRQLVDNNKIAHAEYVDWGQNLTTKWMLMPQLIRKDVYEKLRIKTPKR